MSIKPDHWIRKMCQEHKMIDPFVEGQVAAGVVSYGISSYGYDIRVADEFKIFTSATGELTVIDPKHFDPKGFNDFKGDVCVIPPNSFALARTVEYFRIPRNVLAVCVGKCITGDTRVVDAETGEYIPISEFAAHQQTLGLEQWQLKKVPVSAFIPQGVKPVYELTTRMGLKIKATENHPFRQLSGWTPLSELRPGDRIAAARQIPVFGKTELPEWEAVLLGLMISEGQCDTPGHSPTFTSQDPALVAALEQCVKEGLGGDITYKQRYGYRIVNKKGRGGKVATNHATLWLRKYGLTVGASDKFVPQAVFKAPREAVKLFLQALFSGDGSTYRSGQAVFLEYYSRSRRLIEDVHHLLLRFGIISLIREKLTHLGQMSYRIQLTDREQMRRFAREIGFWPGSIKQTRLEQEIIPQIAEYPEQKSNFDTLPADARGLVTNVIHRTGVPMRSITTMRPAYSQSVPMVLAKEAANLFSESEFATLASGGPIWDVVSDIRYLGNEDVYDLTIPAAHNFVANDLIVHNSTYARMGIVLNVTPLEPGWEGYLVLEISNTTPLPCRIYANEGIGQLLFFEGSEPPEISYSERKGGGKYQGQHGIQLPKV